MTYQHRYTHLTVNDTTWIIATSPGSQTSSYVAAATNPDTAKQLCHLLNVEINMGPGLLAAAPGTSPTTAYQRALGAYDHTTETGSEAPGTLPRPEAFGHALGQIAHTQPATIRAELRSVLDDLYITYDAPLVAVTFTDTTSNTNEIDVIINDWLANADPDEHAAIASNFDAGDYGTTFALANHYAACIEDLTSLLYEHDDIEATVNIDSYQAWKTQQ